MLDNCHSNPCRVSSGVPQPQGSVLGPLPFLLYINDLPNNITSTIRLYADDAIVYRIIHSNDDIKKLQEDVNYIIFNGQKTGLCYSIYYLNVNISPFQTNTHH